MAGAMFESEARGLPLLRRGKVRDVYKPSEEHLIIVACDRISAFDHVLPTPIPDKGRILTQISNFWFEKSAHIIPNHIVDPNPGPQWYPELDWYFPEFDGRTVLVRATKPLADRGDRARVPVRLRLEGVPEDRDGLRHPAAGRSARSRRGCPKPIFTPSTKAQAGHDENISFDAGGDLVGRELAEQSARHQPRALPRRGRARAGAGHHHRRHQVRVRALDDGELILIDEVLDPGLLPVLAGRAYEPGRAQPSFDKQFVRDYLEADRMEQGGAALAPLPEGSWRRPGRNTGRRSGA